MSKKIKLPLLIAVNLPFLFFGSAAQAKVNGGCEAKERAIQERIQYARKFNNIHAEAGLERALSNVRTWCDDTSLQSKSEQKVFEKEQDVFKAQQELDDATASGKQDKIKKREKKLAKKKADLFEAEQRRDALNKGQ